MTSKLGGLLKGFLGGRSEPTSTRDPRKATEYKGYMIHPASRPSNSQWLTAGVITKSFDDHTAEHHFVRADVYVNKEDAEACAIQKGKRIIDEQGDRMFEEASKTEPE